MMECDYCERTDARPVPVKVIGKPEWRTVNLHETWAVEAPNWECNLKARRGYPKGHREPITEAARKAMVDKTFGPKGWVWGY